MATDIITTEKVTNSEGKTEISVRSGLGEDGFGGSSETCYQGKAQEVCPLIRREAAYSLSLYSSGTHGYFEVDACQVRKGSVLLSYTRKTDWGDEKVTKTILECN